MPRPRRAPTEGRSEGDAGSRPVSRPASRWNRPPRARLVDRGGLLLVAGLVAAGFVLAFLFTHYAL